MTKKRSSPRGILVVHDDTSEKVARLVVGRLFGQGHPVSHRNIRYHYNPEFYHLVLAIGVDDIPASRNTLSYSYTPYAEYYAEKAGSDDINVMELAEYQDQAAEKIASNIIKRFS